ncbi:putative beta-lactamase [Candidatus Rhodobacter oscarellae]|uniref:Putative beta-lactamase n=1 Tax=Candidatus Rhodobacter oscarellae TaxID=1675527 RepID=A0A0J9E7F9_9RHOB|nr:serine hydrolase domain-containing protein [Candidatus Rhodobacter lobularis]KMW58700.1 putative beta-lactamase [Candidatus Rhodobacter lobularis]
MRAALAVLLLGLWPFQAGAAEIGDAYRAWVASHGAAPATLAVISPEGVLTEQLGVAAAPSAAMPLASVSKTLAAQCVLDLARAGALSLADTLQQHLGWQGPQGRVTLGALLTHTSGLWPDSTQEGATGRTLRSTRHAERIIEALRTRPLATPEHRYNNENYLVLGDVLRAAGGADPFETCKARAGSWQGLESLAMAPGTRALGMAGGYAGAAPDLARFVAGLEARADWPSVQVAPGVLYGPGVLMRNVPKGRNMWHFGGICTRVSAENIGAFVVQLASGWSVAALYSGCQDAEALLALQRDILVPLDR